MIYRPQTQLKSLWRSLNLIFFVLILLILSIITLISQIYLLPLIILPFVLLIEIFVLWYIPALFKTLEYRIDDAGVLSKGGVFWRKESTVPYQKITNVDITQGPLERVFGLSKLHLQTAGQAGPEGSKAELVVYGMQDGEAIKEIILAKMGVPQIKLTPKTTHEAVDINILEAILKEVSTIRKKIADDQIR